MADAQTIVLLDDQEDIADLLAEGIRIEGFDVECYTTPPACMERLLRGPLPCLLVVDYFIGEMSCPTLLREVGDTGVHLPIVCITGAPLSNDAQAELQQLGVLEVLVKPVGLDQVLDAIASIGRAGCRA